VAAEYNEASGFDLNPVLTELDLLRNATTSFLEAANRFPNTIDRLMKRLSRLNLMTEGEFGQDPAESRDAFPQLARVKQLPEHDRDNERFLKLQLQRAKNNVVMEFRRLRQLV